MTQKEFRKFTLDDIFTKYKTIEYNQDDDAALDWLIYTIEYFRPINKLNGAEISIAPLLDILKNDEQMLKTFASYIKSVLHEKDFDLLLTDAGIINYSDFIYEIRKRLVEKVLPYQPPKNTIEFVLNQVFYSPNDPKWIAKIPLREIEELFCMIGFESIYASDKKSYALSEVLYGLEVLAQRVSGRALESDVSKMVPEYRNFESPFIGLLREISEVINALLKGKQKYIDRNSLEYKQIGILHQQCEKYIDTAFANSNKYGISIKANQSLLRIRQQLARMKKILSYLTLENEEDGKSQTIQLSLALISLNSNKNNVTKLFNESTQSLAYEVTQHTAQTGEHYITTSKKEYFKMFWSACLGGFIVAFLCVFKLMLSKIDASEFGYAFYYSMNYAFGFITIYLVGATLATKQPAMTASAFTNALANSGTDKKDANKKYEKFAVFYARVFRSQFVAFLGNVIVAFPIAFLLIWGIDVLFDHNIAETKWEKLVGDLNPVTSLAIFHACIAGVFLFFSGIISGTIANRDKYNAVYYRIQQHPILKKIFGKEKTQKISKLYEKKWAGIISNFWFGIFLGSTASVGMFLGLDLDIRHITFASGNLALGIYGNLKIPVDMIVWGVLGVGIIGFFNFIVSFSLSLLLAFRARNMALSELRFVARSVWALFKKRPMLFFFPPKKEMTDDL